MNREELLDRLTQDVLAYVMHGDFPEEHFAGEIKFQGLDERFDDYERLIRLHFVLRPDVVRFVERLPRRLRGVKTQTENVSRTVRGGIDGRIDWPGTVRERYSSNPRDTALFVTENRSENYDIHENIVLRKLLSLIYTTLDDCEQYLRADYDWVTDRWKENLELVDVMTEIFERNVHVTRIREPKAYEPTERMLQRAASARNEVYRVAAELLRQYRRTLSGEKEALRELLEDTAITPDDDETLFELFVLFRFVATIEQLRDDQFRVRTITSGSQEIARMDGDREIVLYHDSSGGDRGLSFRHDAYEKDASELSRSEQVKREAMSVAERYFQDSRFRVSSGRPDVIVLEVGSDDGYEYLITEVKHSARVETVRDGIEETLEYLAFLRRDGERVFEPEEPFGSGWNGLLVVQDIDSETAELQEQCSIRILQASEVEANLERVVTRVLE
jgi:hypothetical protein